MDEKEPLTSIFDKEIGFEEFQYIWNKIKRLAPLWDMVAIFLCIHPYTIHQLEREFPNNDEKCLRRVISHWLAKDYLYDYHGSPTYRMLYESVKHRGGGNDPVLAEEIADEKGRTRWFYIHTRHNRHIPPQYRTWCLEWGRNERRYIFPRKYIFPNDAAPYVKRTLHTVRDEHVLGLVQRLYKLEVQFAEAIYETRDAIPPNLLDEMTKYAKSHLFTIVSPIHTRRSKISTMRTYISCSSSFSVAFFITNITKYMSWFNYGLLIQLVKVYLSDRKHLVKKWCVYRESVKEFFASDNNFAVQYGDTIDFGLPKSIDSKIMILKVVREDYTLNDLFFFHEAIPKALRVGSYRFYLCRVDKGCLELTYSVPDYVCSLIFPLTREQCHSLAKIGIFKLTCGEHVYEIDQLPFHETQITSLGNISINDPLWYENTHTPLHEACWKGITEEVKWFINDEFGQKMFNENLNGWTPPLSAAYGGHMDILRLLNDHSIDMSQGDNDSVTTLHMASYKGHLNIVEYLLNECHIDPDRADSSGNTALLYSALGGHVDLVTLFIAKKSNLFQCNKEGANLSLLACKSGHVELIHTLQSLGLFSFKATDFIGRGIVHYSCMSLNKNDEIFDFILKNFGGRSLLFERDHYGRTPLHIASQFSSTSITMTIINHLGYDSLLDTDYFGWSSLHYMVCALIKCINTTIVFNKLFIPSDLRFLLQFGENDTSNDDYINLNYNTTRLHERVKLFSTLLRKASGCPKFDIDATTKSGQSLMHLAQTSGSVLLVNVVESLRHTLNS